MPDLRIRVHASLAAAEADWAAPGLAGYAFQSFTWMRCWQETLGAASGTRPVIVVLTDPADRVLMILPLGILRRRGVRELCFLGSMVTDYHAPLVDPAFAAGLDAPAFMALWARVLAVLPRHDLIRFKRMPAWLDSPAGAGEAAVPNPFARLSGAVAAGQAQSITLPGTHEAFLKSMKPRFAGDTRRKRRRLAEFGPVRLVLAQDPAAMRTVLDGLVPMKSRRWEETGSRDWFAMPGFRAFYEAMTSAGLPGGTVHATSLMVGDTVVAVHWGLIYRARFYYLMPGWEAGDWVRYSTGRLIIDDLIGLVIPQGVRVFDFTVGDEPYKRDWVDSFVPLVGFVQPRTVRGRAVLAAEAALLALARRAKRVAWLRDAVRRVRGLPPLVRAAEEGPTGCA